MFLSPERPIGLFSLIRAGTSFGEEDDETFSDNFDGTFKVRRFSDLVRWPNRKVSG
jgi:hypothetical protein